MFQPLLPLLRAALLAGALGLLAFAGHAQSATRAWTDAFQSNVGAEAEASWTDPRGTTYVVGHVDTAAALPGLPPVAPNTRPAFLAKATPTNTWQWVRAVSASGVSSFCHFGAVTGDGVGGVYVTGTFIGTVTFAPGITITSMSFGVDGLIARYDSAGTPLWAHAVAAAGQVDPGILLAADAAGAATVAFSLGYPATLGSFPVQPTGSQGDVVVARLSPQGAWQWVAQSSGSANEAPTSLGLDAQGNVYIAGQLTSARWMVNPDSIAQFGATQLFVEPVVVGNSIPFPVAQGFAAKLNGQGQWQWATDALGGATRIEGGVVSAAGDQYLRVAEAVIGDTLVAGGVLSGQWLVKVNAAGQWQWARAMTSPTYTGVALSALALTPAGHPCVIGTFGLTWQLDSLTVLTDSLRPAWNAYSVGVVQLDPAGQLEWAVAGRGVGLTTWPLSRKFLAGGGFDAQGRMTVVGAVLDSLTLGPVELTTAAPPTRHLSSLFVAHIGPAGPTGVPTALASTEIIVYPNPVRRGHTLSLDPPATWAGARVDILNVLGQVVSTSIISAHTRLPTAHLPAGLYTVRTRAAGHRLSRRVVVE